MTCRGGLEEVRDSLSMRRMRLGCILSDRDKEFCRTPHSAWAQSSRGVVALVAGIMGYYWIQVEAIITPVWKEHNVLSGYNV